MVSTRQSYNDELEALRQNISSMGQAVDLAMHQAMKALIEQDLNLAQAVIDGDDVIDAMEIAIEDKCMVLIARQQPLAKDLRIIGTVGKGCMYAVAKKNGKVKDSGDLKKDGIIVGVDFTNSTKLGGLQ